MLLLAALAGGARADSPPRLLPPRETVCSAGGTACAEVDRTAGRTVVRRRDARTPLWTMDAAPADFALSADGRWLVETQGGGGLLDLEPGPDDPLLTVHDAGGLVRRVTLRDLGLRPEALPRTVSHRHWGYFLGFDGCCGVLVQTFDGRPFRIALADGTITEMPGRALPGTWPR